MRRDAPFSARLPKTQGDGPADPASHLTTRAVPDGPQQQPGDTVERALREPFAIRFAIVVRFRAIPNN